MSNDACAAIPGSYSTSGDRPRKRRQNPGGSPRV
jgi:hypothetical protein